MLFIAATVYGEEPLDTPVGKPTQETGQDIDVADVFSGFVLGYESASKKGERQATADKTRIRIDEGIETSARKPPTIRGVSLFQLGTPSFQELPESTDRTNQVDSTESLTVPEVAETPEPSELDAAKQVAVVTAGNDESPVTSGNTESDPPQPTIETLPQPTSQDVGGVAEHTEAKESDHPQDIVQEDEKDDVSSDDTSDGFVFVSLDERLMAATTPTTVATASNETQSTPVESEPHDHEPDESDSPVQAEPIDLIANLKLDRKNGSNIRIDGHLDEMEWAQVAGFENMIVVSPDTMAEPAFRTHTRMFYTDKGLYVSADMEQPIDTLVQRLSARDVNLNRDGFGITIDTSGEGLFGFWFAVNLGDTKEDGKVLPERNFTRQWDGAWQGATKVTEHGWAAEIFIPWSIIAMPPGGDVRRMNFYVNRKVAFQNEWYGWPALPFTGSRFMSALQPMEMAGVNPKQQWELFPYATSSADGIYDEAKSKVGVNFSWRPAPHFQLSGAAAPDFGAVESDDVVVNLSAYETYFPEKRLFFLEGSEVFQTTPRSIPSTGSSRGGGARRAPLTWNPEPTTLLNTRRIGGAAKHYEIPDGISVAGPELSKPTDLLAAAKVVGQSKQIRYGLLAAVEDDVQFRGAMDDTDESTVITTEGRNFGIARMLWDRPVTQGRQAHGFIHTFANTPDYVASVSGIDSHILTADGKLSIDAQLINSNKEDESGFGGFADFRYTPRQGIFHRISVDYLDDKLDISDLGFLRRNDMQGLRYTRFYNSSQGLPDYMTAMGIGLFTAAQFNRDGDLIRSYLGTGWNFAFTNQSQLSVQLNWRPPLIDDRSSYGNGSFEIPDTQFHVITFGTDSSKKFALSVQGGMQSEDLGDPAYLGDIGFTFSPITRFSLNYDIRYRDSEGWLLWVGDDHFNRYFAETLSQIFSLDFFFTARQQFRATMQWTGIQATERDLWQIGNGIGPLIAREPDEDGDASDFTISRLTAQVRYRWEIAPLSDLFLVYTRGSNLPSQHDADFNYLFTEALKDPVVDLLIFKLRYRFGS